MEGKFHCFALIINKTAANHRKTKAFKHQVQRARRTIRLLVRAIQRHRPKWNRSTSPLITSENRRAPFTVDSRPSRYLATGEASQDAKGGSWQVIKALETRADFNRRVGG